MDLKKIKPNDVLGYLDDLVSKIPESISSILTKVMIGILVIACAYAAHYGYQKGYGSAVQEGQELAKDTKSLFLEDIEREYNRKRKNIRMPSADNLINDDLNKTEKHYESYGRTNESNSVIPQGDSLLENDKSIRSYKRKENTSPLAELNDSVPMQDNPSYDSNSDADLPMKRKIKLKDNFDSPLSNQEGKSIDSVLDRLDTSSDYEKRILTKKEVNKKRKSNLEPQKTNDAEAMKNDSGKLMIPEKLRKKNRNMDLLPTPDGKE